MANGLSVAEDLVVLKCLEVAHAPAGVFVFIPDEFGFVYHIIVNMGVVLVVHICFLVTGRLGDGAVDSTADGISREKGYM